MSNLAYHAHHFKAGSVGAVGKHNWEKRGDKDTHSNQDIDPSRSHLNFQPQPIEGSLYMAAKKRIQDACTGRVTSNSNWITETIVYPPEDVVERYRATGDDADLRRYFQDVTEWHRHEFGAANILAATVHLDETTPHGHIDIVPLTEAGKLSSKEVFARTNLRRHHTELAAFLKGRGWDIQRGNDTKDKQVRSKTVAEYKKDAEAAKVEIEREIHGLQKEVNTLTAQANENRQTVNKLVERTKSFRQENLAAYDALQKTSAKLDERREIIRELDAFIEGSHDEIAAYNERIGELQDAYNVLSDNLDAKQQELQETLEQLGAAKGEIEGLAAERTSLRAEKGTLEEELTVIRQAAAREYEAGAKQMGRSEWIRQIEDARKAVAKDNRIKELEATVSWLWKFIQVAIERVPLVKQLWERYESEREKKKKLDEHVL